MLFFAEDDCITAYHAYTLRANSIKNGSSPADHRVTHDKTNGLAERHEQICTHKSHTLKPTRSQHHTRKSIRIPTYRIQVYI